ncbi:aspartyl-phosphate phosphatase Spo0E family protein [Halobacillus massiliensis]|uniref:aspartyl-phosphate phosphatase Spo0E family protein n=1 Tax=Halobacillus massiliensis TaxID=1926286 RepID=UPI00117B675B|nr:aspartyl-phosphate phosphatase Spo0E family protein [Halobacillus massiliensis]
MSDIANVEAKIEELRMKMYEAYNQGMEYEEVIKISQELDHLLNQLDSMKKKRAPSPE